MVHFQHSGRNHRLKKNAQDHAKELRKDGFKARVIRKHVSGNEKWAVYVVRK